MTLESTILVTEMSTRNGPRGNERPAHKADNLTAICKPISRKCSDFDFSATYRPPWPATGDSFISFIDYIYIDIQTYVLLWINTLVYIYLILIRIMHIKSADVWVVTAFISKMDE
jgi:hypothetical protein